MPAKTKPLPTCHCCGTKQIRGGAPFRSAVAKWELHPEFHLSAFQRCSTAAKGRKPGEFSSKPAAVRSKLCCSACAQDWDRHCKTGGKAALEKELTRLAMHYCALAGITYHPEAHGIMHVVYWDEDNPTPVGRITRNTIVVDVKTRKALFCYVRDAMGPDTKELAALNFRIVSLGLPCKRSKARTGGGDMTSGGYRLCRHDSTTGRFKGEALVEVLTDVTLGDLIDEAAYKESEALRQVMPVQWSELAASVHAGTFATLYFGRRSTPFGYKAVTRDYWNPQHDDPGEFAGFIIWYIVGEGLPPRGGLFRLETLGIEVQPTNGCAVWFNAAEQRHGTDLVVACEGHQTQIGTALVLKKSTQSAAWNQTVKAQMHREEANKVLRQAAADKVAARKTKKGAAAKKKGAKKQR